MSTTTEPNTIEGELSHQHNPKLPKPWFRNPWVIAGIAAFVTLPLLRPFLRHIPKPPPVMSQLPDFQLVDQHNRPFGLAQMKGHVTIVSFFFTRCPSICPALTQAMMHLQGRFAQHKLPIRLLTITVDPTHDTPKVLRAYANKYGIDQKRWTLLTGPFPKIEALAIKGFRSAVSRPEKIASFNDITHTSKLIIVDQKGQIRGRPDKQGRPIGYFGTSKLALDEIFHRAQHTLREKFH